MNALFPTRLTVDEFLRWSLEQDGGRFELEGGRIIKMSPQNIGHVATKQRAYQAFEAAIRTSGLPFYAMPDGPTVRIAGDRAYEPDALVALLPEPAGTSLEISNPIIVLEVLSPSPSSMRRDLTTKVSGYALVPSIEHYIVIDPAERIVLPYRRQGDFLVPGEEMTDGTLRLDPPGLEIAVADMLVPASVL